MFNESTFQEVLLLSLAKVNGYVAHVQRKYADLDGNNRTCGPGWEEVP